MVTSFGAPQGNGKDKTFGIDKVMFRLAIFGVLVVAAFVALFSRLWFLQVLAGEDYTQLARENRIRTVHSEPPRGRILDRNGNVLVGNRFSIAVTVDRQVVDTPEEQRVVLRRLSKLLGIKRKQLRERLEDTTASPYKPVAVAYDVKKRHAVMIRQDPEDYPGVGIDTLPVRDYPQGSVAAHILGYVGEINEDELEMDQFRKARPRYEAGDRIGKSGVERSYDRFLRGKPRIERVVVNSTGRVIHSTETQEERPGRDLVLSLDLRIQRIAERALEAGIGAARGAGYAAPDGAAFVMDPTNGEVIAAASFPTYDPSTLADGITPKEWKRLTGGGNDPRRNVLYSRVTQAEVPPGSTFKVPVATAGLVNGIVGPYDYIGCPPAYVYGADNLVFRNWTSRDFGAMSMARSLEVSCDTYYYELGARMENRWGAGNGDGSEKFQAALRRLGFGAPTGIDVPFERGGRVPDKEWCEYMYRETNGAWCAYGWLPGYTINMSIGQGDLVVSPVQMAVSFATVLNGGKVLKPRVGMALERDDKVVREFKSKVARKINLDQSVWSVIRQGMEAVISGSEGTANYAFSGFPVNRVPVGGKTGTAQIGSVDSGKNVAWFVSYAPADKPRYVVAVYLNQAGHGGESAAPVARQIYEGIFRIDNDTDLELGVDFSG